jgi:hypothetical protein
VALYVNHHLERGLVFPYIIELINTSDPCRTVVLLEVTLAILGMRVVVVVVVVVVVNIFTHNPEDEFALLIVSFTYPTIE